jgi:hypothetical protein
MSPRYWSSGLAKSLTIARDATPAEKRLPADLVEGLKNGPPFAREGAVNELARLISHSDSGIGVAAVQVLRECLANERDFQVRAAIETALSRHSEVQTILPASGAQSRPGSMTYLKAALITLAALMHRARRSSWC